MANDALFDDKADEKPAGEGQPVAAPQGVTAAQLQDAITKGLGGLGDDLKQHMAQIGQYVRQATEGRVSNPGQGTPTKNEADDLATQLLNDPEGVVNRLADKWAQTRLTPTLALQVHDRYEDLKDRHRNRIDETYGEGTFDKDILPRMEVLMERMEPAARGSSAHFQSVMSTVMGSDSMLSTLMDKRAAANKAKADAPVGVLVGGRRAPSAPRFSPDDLEFMDDYLRVTGTKIDPKQMEQILDVRRSERRWTTQNFPGVTKAKLEVAAR